MLCFILTTHIIDPITSQYWEECCRCIRRYYTDPIYVIDDHSHYKMDTSQFSECFTIVSEFKGRAELLPYYYFYKYKWADKAVILHDSTFLQQRIPTEDVTTVRFLWHFTHKNERRTQIHNMMVRGLDNYPPLVRRFARDQWDGCFGGQSIITLTFLETIVEKYNLFRLLHIVCDRGSRKAFERVFGIICFQESKELITRSSVCGHIFRTNPRWKLTFDEYKRLPDSRRQTYILIKCFTGR